MNPIVRNIIAIIVGLLVGGAVNMGIVTFSPALVPYPPGTDLSTPEGVAAAIPLFKPINFLMPFLAHALGTFVGALVTALIAATRKMRLALVIGIVNLIGGISAVYMIPAPMWFNVLDLVVAYLPMAFIAGWLATRNKGRQA